MITNYRDLTSEETRDRNMLFECLDLNVSHPEQDKIGPVCQFQSHFIFIERVSATEFAVSKWRIPASRVIVTHFVRETLFQGTKYDCYEFYQFITKLTRSVHKAQDRIPEYSFGNSIYSECHDLGESYLFIVPDPEMNGFIVSQYMKSGTPSGGDTGSFLAAYLYTGSEAECRRFFDSFVKSVVNKTTNVIPMKAF